MVAEFLRPLVVDDGELALDAVREVGSAAISSAAPTRRRATARLLRPMISDWRKYESWREAGAPTAYDTANRLYKEKLAAYVPPPMDPSIREELEAFVARRKTEGGVKTDF